MAARQQRQVLAALLVDARQFVSTQRLVDEVWGDRPPRTARNTVHAYVLRLRRLLGDGGARLLVTRDHGYELAIGPGDLDAWEFERLVAAGRAELAAGRPEPAATQLARALSLWRGPVLADVADRPASAARIAQLEQARMAATEDHLTALLELGRHTEAADRLHRLVEEQPLRESLWLLLMRAERVAGRRADALLAYGRARRVLHDELGLEPGPALRQLRSEILADEPPPGTALELLSAALAPHRAAGDIASETQALRLLAKVSRDLDRLAEALRRADPGPPSTLR